MKALVLAAGSGSRLGPVTSRQNKCLLDCGQGPIVDEVVSCVAELPEVTEVVLVVGYRSEDLIRHFSEHPAARPIRFVQQAEQRGIVDAIECARPHVDDDEVLLRLGDEVLCEARYREFIDDFRANSFYASLGAFPSPDPRRAQKTYTFSSDENRHVRRLVEKPVVPLGPKVGTGSVLFSAGALAYVERTPASPLRGVRDLVGVLQAMVDDGRVVGSFDLCSGYANVNTSDDLREATALTAARGAAGMGG